MPCQPISTGVIFSLLHTTDPDYLVREYIKESFIISNEHCELCQAPGGDVLWEDALCRVIRVSGPEGVDYPGYCRVIWRAHVREMSDLPSADRRHLMALVFATESALRALYQPHKINLASLGNQVPHLHWHVIPRFTDDPRFPAPIWAGTKRQEGPAMTRPLVGDQALHEAIALALSEEHGGSA